MEVICRMKEEGIDVDYTVDIEVGQDVDEAIELFGDMVFERFCRTVYFEAESILRRMLAAGYTIEMAREKLNGWNPGDKVGKLINPLKAVTKKMEKLDLSELEALQTEIERMKRNLEE